MTLAGLFKQLGVDSCVDFLKLDIEGTEYDLLQTVESEILQKGDRKIIKR